MGPESLSEVDGARRTGPEKVTGTRKEEEPSGACPPRASFLKKNGEKRVPRVGSQLVASEGGPHSFDWI